MFESSFIRDIVVFLASNQVLVLMDTGAYLYSGVPAEIAAMFLVAESKGKFFSEFIRNKYTFTKTG